jgi:probable phosphoglycerate mutase
MPILKKDFYFLRHGETSHNAERILSDDDVPLNETGKNQAKQIASIIAKLPISTVCHSPLKRAVETKNIVTQELKCPHIEISELRECTGSIWTQMMQLEKDPNSHTFEIKKFFDQILIGINQALQYAGPVLLVAHGGFHWGLCHLLGIHEEKKIDNCIPVRFTWSEIDQWKRHRV